MEAISLSLPFKVNYVNWTGTAKHSSNELLVKNNLYAVFNGKTAASFYFKNNENLSGKTAAQIAKNAFEKNDKSMYDLADEANQSLLTHLVSNNIRLNLKEANLPEAILLKENRFLVSFAAVRFFRDCIDCIALGDSKILFIKKDKSYEIFPDSNDENLDMKLKARELAKQRPEDMEKALHPFLLERARLANIEYGALNGEDSAMNFVKQMQAKVELLQSIIIMTSGFLIPKKELLAKNSWEQFIRHYQEHFKKEHYLRMIAEKFRDLEEGDPEIINYPRVKKHMNLTAISIDFV